ncbi:MAG: hypothetical protein RLY31_2631 [Bacteroidota bacterium]|jgi:DNA mismatch repair protein MutL
MADIIQLLPEAIANQIAAGEVVQRPAAVVKELAENAIDAGAISVKIIVKDAGKTLIQVIDNGSGMSASDARMCFERHATSKIREARDLFAIRTMGFRGEAMASIAAVAQVEMRTRLHKDELGTRIAIEASQLTAQEPCPCAPGTNTSVRNLFFNVPARRNFLKSNAIEMRHILDEFQRIALANVDVFFSLHHNGNEIFHLPASNLRQRIVGLFGNAFNPKLVPVEEETDVMAIGGFIGKPEFARKTRGEQMFFVNHRFIKSGYLHHAVMTAYEDLLPPDTYPFYVLFLEIDPSRIDINVHPTKQEIKFDDERLVYDYLRVAVRHALGQHNITPSLDFDQERSFVAIPPLQPSNTIPGHHDYASGQPNDIRLHTDDKWQSPPLSARDRSNLQHWQNLFVDAPEEGTDPSDSHDAPTTPPITIESGWSAASGQEDPPTLFSQSQKNPYQIHGTFIVSHIKSGFLLIDQQAAHERILYERFLGAIQDKQPLRQQELFPQTVTLTTADAAILTEILPEVNALGFEMEPFGKDAFIIRGVPADIAGKFDATKSVDQLLEQFKEDRSLQLDHADRLARSMARSAAIKRGQQLSAREMQELIDQLFACAMPFKSPRGRHCFLTYELEELDNRFKG